MSIICSSRLQFDILKLVMVAIMLEELLTVKCQHVYLPTLKRLTIWHKLYSYSKQED